MVLLLVPIQVLAVVLVALIRDGLLTPELLEAQVLLLCATQIHLMQHCQLQALPLSHKLVGIEFINGCQEQGALHSNGFI
jgi:hypothetical protein